MVHCVATSVDLLCEMIKPLNYIRLMTIVLALRAVKNRIKWDLPQLCMNAKLALYEWDIKSKKGIPGIKTTMAIGALCIFWIENPYLKVVNST